jgi:hypothetical protein
MTTGPSRRQLRRHARRLRRDGFQPMMVLNSGDQLPETAATAIGRALAIAELVGHKTTVVTQKVYRHQLRPVITTGATTMNTIFTGQQDAIRMSPDRFADLFRRGIQPFHAAQARLRDRDQLGGILPGRVQLRDRLVEESADLADQVVRISGARLLVAR